MDNHFPAGWPLSFEELAFPFSFTLKCGHEFACTACLSESSLVQVQPEKVLPSFDRDASPHNEKNIAAADARGWTFDGKSKQYKDPEGYLMADEFGQPLG